jgi:Chloroplast import apparatus Tic20-like/EF-hand domain pair
VKLAEAFKILDTDDDGSISLEELRTGLANQLQSVITEEQASKIMKRFDVSGDGSIQLDEFKGVDAFRNIFEKILQEEKTTVIEATQKAIAAKKIAETAAAKASAIQEQINSLPPSNSDKIVSALPYLLPLADVLPYSKDFIVGNNLENNNFIFEFASSVFLLYQSIPFSGLVAFFLLNILTNNLKLNRLVRFNMQQAIFLDIALIFPSLIGSVLSILAKQGDLEIPADIGALGSTATFLVISASIIYSVISSLLGIVPDKLPLVSERAKLRVPTAEEYLKDLEAQDNEWNPPGPGEKKVRKNRPEKTPEVEQVKDADEEEGDSEKK